MAFLQRGRERYAIYCTPCHDAAGTGHGMIVSRGLKQPASFNEERLRAAPPEHFVQAIENGYQSMLPMRSQIPPADRAAIAAYIKVLQKSQHWPARELPEEDRQRLASATLSRASERFGSAEVHEP